METAVPTHWRCWRWVPAGASQDCCPPALPPIQWVLCSLYLVSLTSKSMFGARQLGELRSPATPQQWRNLRNQVCNISVWVVWGGLCPFSQTLKSREFPNTGRGSRCHMAKKKNPTQTPQTTPTQTITTTIKQPKISKNKIPKISPTGVHPFGSPTVTYLLFPTFTFQKKKFLLFSWVKL